MQQQMKHKQWERHTKTKGLEETSQMFTLKVKSKKTAMDTALDTDTMDFGEFTGHLQAYEMNEKLKEELSKKI